MNGRVAMIPARLGSERVPKKTLRMLGGKPLLVHTIEAALNSNAFREVYVNSEAEVFRQVAESHGAKCYQQPLELSTNKVTNDQFVLDFIEHVACDVVVQLNPTSPFIETEDMMRALAMFDNGGADTVLAVKEVQIAGVFKGRPLNFDPMKPMPQSQDLTPFFVFCNGMFAWRAATFRRNMLEFGCAVYGGSGTTQHCVLDGDAALDIDTEQDFRLAECLWQSRRRRSVTAKCLNSGGQGREHVERDVPSILANDGVGLNDLHDTNHPLANIGDLLERGSHTASWSKRIIDSPSNSVTVISQLPGEGNRRHYHNDWDEWWYILEGEWIYEIDGREQRIHKHELVFIERNKVHKVTAAGRRRAVRMAVSRADVDHIYLDAPAELDRSNSE